MGLYYLGNGKWHLAETATPGLTPEQVRRINAAGGGPRFMGGDAAEKYRQYYEMNFGDVFEGTVQEQLDELFRLYAELLAKIDSPLIIYGSQHR